jgi:hypothetical protein
LRAVDEDDDRRAIRLGMSGAIDVALDLFLAIQKAIIRTVKLDASGTDRAVRVTGTTFEATVPALERQACELRILGLLGAVCRIRACIPDAQIRRGVTSAGDEYE